ncbi:hypothetical protein [Phenylobacterium immobile]|uniref:hypothetical protein n=1 Tax=Phenylobacterium immobile TaxID=21 RepID=UPI000B216F36|nr:hypothetical protein [Phenylobacterium immobile]
MAVVINDFEVVAEPAPAPGASAPEVTDGAPSPAALEVERILRNLADRLVRVEA